MSKKHEVILRDALAALYDATSSEMRCALDVTRCLELAGAVSPGRGRSRDAFALAAIKLAHPNSLSCGQLVEIGRKVGYTVTEKQVFLSLVHIVRTRPSASSISAARRPVSPVYHQRTCGICGSEGSWNPDEEAWVCTREGHVVQPG